MPGAVLKASAEHRSGIVLVTIGTVAWSSAGLFVRLLTLDPWTIIVWRSAFGTVFIGAYVVWRYGRSTLGIVRRMGTGGVLVTLYSAAAITLFVPALQNTSVANAMTIYAALPFVVAGIAWTWLGERPAARTLVASLVAMLGLMVMLDGPHSRGLRSGDLLAVGATLVSALMTVEARHSRDVKMLPVACLANLLAVLFALPFAAPVTVLSAHDLTVVAAFGLCAMALGLMLYLIGSALIPAALSALIGTLSVPMGALWAWVGVGEVPATSSVAGAAIVLAGVLGALLLEQRAARQAIAPGAGSRLC
jgi:drug/metabolite transporter (DMT)-like permease